MSHLIHNEVAKMNENGNTGLYQKDCTPKKSRIYISVKLVE